MEISDTLFVIPARGGSKGLLRKNILPLAGKPLICYTIDAARGVTSVDNICVSSDDAEIIEVVEKYGLDVPFVRPSQFATDTASSQDVLLHALQFYKDNLNRDYSRICLLQPTSPLRTSQHIRGAFSLWTNELDMVVSVKECKSNPYFNLFEEQENGFLKKSKEGNYTRRQDAPTIWEYNGAIYIISVEALYRQNIGSFERVRKFVMDASVSVDIDTEEDFENVLSKKCMID